MGAKDIAARLRTIRAEVGFTLPRMSAETGVPWRTIQNYERAVSEPSYGYLMLMCTKFGVDANWLLTGEGDIYKEGVVESSPQLEDLLNRVGALEKELTILKKGPAGGSSNK